ncbi:response regulator [Evansella sp. AB-rgal1]|uniref:response regulator n=1 Tax=Evansella sp. AB-rgal1 TaxID=3242696 RepID=UPI00359EC46D
MKKILIADDEEVLRMLIVDTLEDLDVDIIEAEDGQEAWEKVNENTFDLIILDYMMPRLTGYEVLLKVKSHEKLKQVPVLMLTAKSQQKDRQQLLEAGADYFMEKPFRPTQLMSFVEELLHD